MRAARRGRGARRAPPRGGDRRGGLRPAARASRGQPILFSAFSKLPTREYKYLGLLGTSKSLVSNEVRANDIARFREKLDRELKSGVVRLTLLLVIDRAGPEYGYRILRRLQEWTHGRLAFKEGTAYPILQSLERDGFVTSFWGESDGGPRRKYYQTTALGKLALNAALEDWRGLVDSMDLILDNVPKKEARP